MVKLKKVFFQIFHQIIQNWALFNITIHHAALNFTFLGFFNPLCNDTIFLEKKVNKSMHFLATLSFKQCLFVGCIKVVEGGSRVNLWPESILKIGSHVALLLSGIVLFLQAKNLPTFPAFIFKQFCLVVLFLVGDCSFWLIFADTI